MPAVQTKDFGRPSLPSKLVHTIEISCTSTLDSCGVLTLVWTAGCVGWLSAHALLWAFWSWKEDTDQLHSKAAIWKWRGEGERTFMIFSWMIITDVYPQLKIDQRVFISPSKRKLEINIVQSNFHIEITPRFAISQLVISSFIWHTLKRSRKLWQSGHPGSIEGNCADTAGGLEREA